MASIRPKRGESGASATAKATAKGLHMAGKRKRKSRARSGAVRRRSARGASSTAVAPTRRRRRGGSARRGASLRARFRPTRAGLRPVVPFTIDATVGAAEVIAGKVIARTVRGLTGQQPGSIFGAGIEFVAGITAGLLVATVNREAGERVAIGGVMAPMETLIQRMGIPHISDSLGDDGYYITGTTVGEVGESGGVGGYVEGAGSDGVGGYVTGPALVANG
jgi:hypothetical protein